MLPLLFIWIGKKFFGTKKTYCYPKLLLRRIFLIIPCILFSCKLCAQYVTHTYKVIYRNDSVGCMQLSLKSSGDTLDMKMISRVTIKFILSVQVTGREEAKFENGRLIYSKTYREVNGSEKVNNETRAEGNIYKTSAGGTHGYIQQQRINYNFLMLYLHEPLGITSVYSDNFQKFLTIKKIAEHTYKIDLPDGNYNYYFFRNGICSKVEVHHSLYTITMLLQ
ncbi:MAG TPA: DUF6134 family protein [Chitinophagaceae bacterium]|nr:DUF6134 family protein [Chitinophagaceae bacterium]